jgi:Arc/MetJ family transcription regulator
MSVTAIDVDDESLERARRILGTRTKKDTINTALREVIRTRAVADLVFVLGDDVIEYEGHERLHRDAWGYSATEQPG